MTSGPIAASSAHDAGDPRGAPTLPPPTPPPLLRPDATPAGGSRLATSDPSVELADHGRKVATRGSGVAEVPRDLHAPAVPQPAPAAPTGSSGGRPDPVAALADPAVAAEQLKQADVQRLTRLTRLGVDVTTDELGHVRIEAASRRGELQMNLTADDPAGRSLLAERLPELREQLRASGLDLASLDISARDGAGGHGRREPADGDRQRIDDRTADDGEAADADRPGDRPAVDVVDTPGHLDLRL